MINVIIADNEDVYDQVLDRIRSGCGFVLAICPWGYILNPENTFLTMPYYRIMKAIGVCFNRSCYRGEMNIGDNMAQHGHLLRTLRYVVRNKTNMTVEKMKVLRNILDIPLDSRQEILQILTESTQLLQWILSRRVPSPDSPIRVTDPVLGWFPLYQILAEHIPGMKYPGVTTFPGNVHHSRQVTRLCVTLQVDSHTGDHHPCGFCLLPGETARFQVLCEREEYLGWTVYIGAHTDDLYKTDQDSIRRFPQVVVCRRIEEGVVDFTLSSAFGGNIYLESPKYSQFLSKFSHFSCRSLMEYQY